MNEIDKIINDLPWFYGAIKIMLFLLGILVSVIWMTHIKEKKQ